MFQDSPNNVPTRNTFSKQERLTSKTVIKELFEKGSSFYIYPFRVKFLKTTKHLGTKVLIAVPRKTFKRAVDRNFIKRRIKEAYRLNKSELKKTVESGQEGLALAILFVGKQKLDFKETENKLNLVLERLQKELFPEK